MRAVLWKTAIIAAALFPVASFAQAQAWPNKPIRIISPFPPGGGTDAFARPLAAKLTLQLGQTVLIENRGGAGGTIGADVAAKAAPDGYTFLMGAVHHTVAVTAYKKLPYDLEKDLVPVTAVGYVPDVLVAGPKTSATDLKDFVRYAKANPSKVDYGSSGNGTTRHLAGEIFNVMMGTSLVHVPYKGSGPAMTGLLSGEVDVVFEGLGSASPQIRAGKIRALAVTSAQRSPAFPDVPTMKELGIPFESLSWYGLWAPTGTPPEIIQKMHAEVVKALASPELKASWASQGADPGGETPEQFGRFIKSEIQKWGEAVKKSGVKMD
jgi:tripartite-type tricarboxylate transporter receptor subunit TctC